MFIHGQSDSETYDKFFSSLASCVQDMNFCELRLGSDDEYAMRKSLVFCFPGAVLVACRRHLQTNTLTYAKDVVGMCQYARSTFMSAVFGEHGLASHINMAAFECSFECSLERFRTGLLSQVPEQMRIYFDNRSQSTTSTFCFYVFLTFTRSSNIIYYLNITVLYAKLFGVFSINVITTNH